MTATSVTAPAPFALDRAWDLPPAVSVREEDFGALLYHFGTRRLSFVTSLRLLAVVRALATSPSAAEACEAGFATDPGSPAERAAVEQGLATLARTGMLVERGGDR